jgi:hypothetical protein
LAYSNVGIANMALQRIGAKSYIVCFEPPDDTPNAGKVYVVWDYILHEVLEAVKPKFATIRVPLAQNLTSPANTDVYDFAYTIPYDYICLADDYKDDLAIYPIPGVAPYVIETLADGTLCLMTDYDSTTEGDIYITYIRKITNPTKFTPSFVNTLAFRLAAELCISVTESTSRYELMMNLYMKSKKKAIASNRSQDYMEDEKGSDSWETAGR